MTKFMVSIVLFLGSVSVFASEETGYLSDTSVKYLAYFFSLAITAYGGTAAQSKTASVALEGIARNPSAANKIQTPMILALALMESLVIFSLISVFFVEL